jgi:hypothetical protein
MTDVTGSGTGCAVAQSLFHRAISHCIRTFEDRTTLNHDLRSPLHEPQRGLTADSFNTRVQVPQRPACSHLNRPPAFSCPPCANSQRNSFRLQELWRSARPSVKHATFALQPIAWSCRCHGSAHLLVQSLLCFNLFRWRYTYIHISEKLYIVLFL